MTYDKQDTRICLSPEMSADLKKRQYYQWREQRDTKEATEILTWRTRMSSDLRIKRKSTSG